jgi:4-diphosphocytidyl-2-C-methyl-D-erythritol kinase
MRARTPAKLNLHLRVGPRRQDGFHPLLTWMCTVALFDSMTIDRRAEPGLELSCDRPELPCDASNLVWRAWNALSDAGASRTQPEQLVGLTVHLEKRIPMGAGLGGGSSDAAGLLRAVNRLGRLGYSVQDLASIGARLGSDVPFFLHGPSGICRGRGEQVDPAPVPAARWAVVVLPPFGLSTAAVYRQFDEMMLGNLKAVENAPDWHDWAPLPAEQLLPRLVNDLEPPAFALQPQLPRLRHRLERLLRRPVRMSGSGSSLFTLYDEEPACHDAAERAARDAQVHAMPLQLAPENE